MALKLCPECKKDDQSRKLSSILATDTFRKEEFSSTSGTIKGKGTGQVWDWEREQGILFGKYRYSGQVDSSSKQDVNLSTFKSSKEQSDLAVKIAPEFAIVPAPYITKPTDFARIGISILAACLILFVLVITAGAWGGVYGPSPLLIGPGAAYLLVYYLILGPWRKRSPFQRGIKAQEENEQKKAEYQKKREAWASARAYWDTLYYCRRDDIVFDPAHSDKVIPASRAAIAKYCWEVTADLS